MLCGKSQTSSRSSLLRKGEKFFRTTPETLMPEFDDDDPRRPADELRRIIRYQRWIVAIVLAQIALWLGFVLLSWVGGQNPGGGLGFPTVLTFFLGAAGGVFAFLTYWSIRGPLAAIIMGLGAIPPCMGILVLMVVNSTATNVLKSNGVRMRFFWGAVESDIPDDDELYDDEGW